MKFALLFTLTFLAGLGASAGNEVMVKRKYYELSFNTHHLIPSKVSYTLETSQLRNCVARNDRFRPDPSLSVSPQLLDYKGSGFDRGHMVPAGDMKFDPGAMEDTFYLSNICPQPPNYNRGMWAKLETLIRAWAKSYKKIWIVTGPIIDPGLPQIGDKNRISTPREFFKVILRKEKDGYRGIGFLMPTTLPYHELSPYTLSINTIEKLAGIDFFKFIGKTEEDVEEQLDLTAWDFKASFDYLPCTSGSQSQTSY